MWQAMGISSGLAYLHSQQVIHADLKSVSPINSYITLPSTSSIQDNVLLSPTMRPLLTDFGISRQTIASMSTTTASSGGTLRWKAPELLNDAGKENEKSDVWALGMTILV